MNLQTTAVALARMLNITRQRVYQLAKERIIPAPIERGKFDLVLSVQQYISFKELSQAQLAIQINLREEQARLTKAQADIAEFELGKKRSELAPVEDLEKAMSAITEAIRTSTRDIPQRAATLLLGETDETRFKTVLMSEIDQALVIAANAEIDWSDDE